MLPKRPSPQDDLELFRSRLENIIDLRHPLVRLPRRIDLPVFDGRLGALFVEGAGRPGLPTRLMVTLHLLKHMGGLSDEAVCARYLDSLYVQANRAVTAGPVATVPSTVGTRRSAQRASLPDGSPSAGRSNSQGRFRIAADAELISTVRRSPSPGSVSV